MRIIGIRKAIEHHEAILAQHGFFCIIEVQVAVDTVEVFGFLLAVPRRAGFAGVC